MDFSSISIITKLVDILIEKIIQKNLNIYATQFLQFEEKQILVKKF